MTARHILSYARTWDGGGVERALLRLAGGWIDAGRTVTLVVGSQRGPLAREVPAGVRLIHLGDPRWRALLALPGIVAAERPDVLFCPGSYYTSLAAWTRLRLGRRTPPIVAKLSNSPARGDHDRWAAAAHRWWLRRHGSFLDHLVAMTYASAAEAQAVLAMRGRVSVIPNPPALPSPLSAWGTHPVERTVVGVGRLVRQKRWDRLVAALPLLPPEITLTIHGDGPERIALLAQAERLGVAERFSLPGYAADPFVAMRRAGVLALASDYEGTPGVLREALSVGTPVVATRSSVAVDEIVADASLGTVVARDDQSALVAALRHWLAAPRPVPVPPPGAEAASDYLALFDRLLV